ncbi:cation diffusion facilitator family transporter [Cnuibacter physcomitrellae]|uniref:cation diffusion facilitator family transporter n=1 Tax=Cnuibacter physcomitrellae TaxID=1619308 RepID=UPI00217618FC|nr:cation diffusion facilitator family transporter [Cnuibacter physcomitrellae]MCS5498766.1 cation diffusion facilitator family transporter [Cnuibacter physcomitrellae]
MTVVIAFLANLLVAVAKTFAAVVTGSASLLAEAAHSWADAGNEIFLLVADRRSVRPKDGAHPLGYGREAFLWSLFAAVGVFTVGAVVSVMHGVQELFEPEPEAPSAYLLGYIVLGVSALLEGTSFLQSVVQVRRGAGRTRRRPIDYVLNSSDSTLRAVFFEDFAALIGLGIAALALMLHQVTGIAAFDAAGSILIGVLLGAVAIVLINRNFRLLIGWQPGTVFLERMGRLLLSQPEIQRVTYLHLEFVGPQRVYLVAAVDIVGDSPEPQVAVALARLARRIEEDEAVETAVLTLSAPDDRDLAFGDAPAPPPASAPADGERRAP